MSREQPEASEKPAPALRPPDFLLPKSDLPAARRRSGDPEIYLSWGGEVYGPAAVAEVVKGVRTSWFEEGTLYWFEGRSDWRPVGEFPDIAGGLTGKRNAPAPSNESKTPAPAEPAADNQTGETMPVAPKKPKMPRISKPKGDYRGIGIVVVFVLLAVGLTVGILLLLHMFRIG